jgi:hypothetical protein
LERDVAGYAFDEPAALVGQRYLNGEYGSSWLAWASCTDLPSPAVNEPRRSGNALQQSRQESKARWRTCDPDSTVAIFGDQIGSVLTSLGRSLAGPPSQLRR